MNLQSTRKWFAPEVIQTSVMDCGPAALKCVLDGFGVHASYGRLREACQTDVDGTSIEMLETTASSLGLDCEQVMVPVDHLFHPLASNLPAIVVTQLSNGGTHFTVVWRRIGSWLQVMDPAAGRRWVSIRQFLDRVYRHSMPVPADGWREWASSEQTLAIQEARLSKAGVPPEDTEEALGLAASDSSWLGFASLDAAARLLASLRDRKAIENVRGLLPRLVRSPGLIPESYWSVSEMDAAVQASSHSGDDDPEAGGPEISFRGAVLVRLTGRNKQPDLSGLPAVLRAAVTEKPARPIAEMARALREDGWLSPAMLAGAIVLAGFGVALQALLFRALIWAVQQDITNAERVKAIAAVLSLTAVLGILEWRTQSGLLRFARKFEAKLRWQFSRKLPLLEDRFLGSRLISDMAQRVHNTHMLRQAPALGGRLIRAASALAFTVAGIAWLFPGSATFAILGAITAVAIPLLAQPLLAERDLRQRELSSALNRNYLDTLEGLTALRSHGGENAMRRVHEEQLNQWAAAGARVLNGTVAADGLHYAVALIFAAGAILAAISTGATGPSLLLLAFWAMSISQFGREIGHVAWQYPAMRNTLLRFLEPINAPEETLEVPSEDGSPETLPAASITMDDVSVVAGGHTILDQVSLEIEPGEHVAIVGPSGAGKSTLAGLLLGWHKPASGQILVDGQPLDGVGLTQLRSSTAWVDPQVRLWNQSLWSNLAYGSSLDRDALNEIAEAARVDGIASRLSDGLETVLGEAGVLVAGGQGQRVRFGRALAREDARLVILDEPARGLDREQRAEMVRLARRNWAEATLLCVTHDIAETFEFDRVLVIEQGRVVEDGSPQMLRSNPGSRYRHLCDTEWLLRRDTWSSNQWRRARVKDGLIQGEAIR